MVLTANYDLSIEKAVEASGRQPVTYWLDRATAWAPPADDQVHVIHLHGIASEPSSLVMPGESTRRLETDDRFQTVLRAAVANHVVLYLGFALGETETHLRQELDWLARSFTDAGTHHLLLPAGVAGDRGVELQALADKELVEVHLYDEQVDGHAPVLAAALTLAPQSPAHSTLLTGRAAAVVEHYRPGAVVFAEPADDRIRLQSRAMAAELGLNSERYATARDIVDSGRAVLEAAPGMGKTQALLSIGHRHAGAGSRAVYLRLPAFAAGVQPQPEADDPAASVRTFLRAMRDGLAFDDTTSRPTPGSMTSGSYLFLLDAFDEVTTDARPGVLRILQAAVESFPQHDWVVATRPTADLSALGADGFASFAIVESRAWGREYLTSRSIPADRVQALADRSPNVYDLIAVPIYAAAVADPLAARREVPDTPLEILVATERHAIEPEAEYHGTDPRAVFDYLQRLAVLMEIRGVSEAPTAELAAVTGRGDLAGEALRTQLARIFHQGERPGRGRGAVLSA